MSEPERIDYPALLKRAYVSLEKLERRLEDAARARNEPIAVLGIGCRFPGGASDPESFWNLVSTGVDAVREVPPDRWDADAYYDPDPDAPGKTYTRSGGFLEDIRGFDPQFFGISPREAASMDPQQRLLLEVAWEALERGGQAPDRLAGTATGVFVGISVSDYAQLGLYGDPELADAYAGTGNAHSVAAGRVSYLLGLHGPNLAVDTSCSSSLVAVHLACQSIRAGECRMALAGGVSLILSPAVTICFSKLRAMARDGRCKTFDAAADGYGRGEGCGIVVLKRLSDAIADGDPVLALIRGSATNHDGPSGGLTVPNPLAQQAVIRQALAAAGVDPSEVSYVETHGTGTPLGDPIEVGALAEVFGPGHGAARPLMIGSVKTNVGHLEAAAGIVGLIKLVLAVQRREIPPHLHFQKPNPRVEWSALPVKVVTERTPWEAEGRRIAGVSAFGFSGTNAHVIVEEAPELARAGGRPERQQQAEAKSERQQVEILPLSAKTDAALEELARRYTTCLESSGERLGDLCYTAGAGRSHFAHRCAVVGRSAAELREKLQACARAQTGATRGAARRSAPARIDPRIAFLYPGQGSTYAGMGRDLYDTQQSFRGAIERSREVVKAKAGWDLVEVLYGSKGESLEETEYAQPALVAIAWGLTEVWRGWGVEPAWVMGHSVGEYGAACAAGILRWEDGLSLVVERARLMQQLERVGAMAAVEAGEERVREAIGGGVSVAAVNGPESVVISGRREAVERAAERVGARWQRLKVSHAFHSELMNPVLDDLERAAAGMSYGDARIGIVSNLTGRVAVGEELRSGRYWRRHAREAVRFREGMATLAEEGCDVFIEVGPGTTLLGLGRRFIDTADASWLPSLESRRDEREELLSSVAALYARGGEIDWRGVHGGRGRRMVALPTYPFERRPYWASPDRRTPRDSGNARHPLVGGRVRSALNEVVFESRVGTASLPFLDDHRIYGLPIFPASAYFEAVLGAAGQAFGSGSYLLEDVVIQDALVLPESGDVSLRVSLRPEDGATAGFQVSSPRSTPPGAAESDVWKVQAYGTVRCDDSRPFGTTALELEEIRARCCEEVPVAALYRSFESYGLEYGPLFQSVRHLARRDGEAVGEVHVPRAAGSTDRFHFHPALADGCLQVLAAALPLDQRHDAYLPVSFESLRVRAQPAGRLWCHALGRRDEGADVLRGELSLVDDSGAPIAELRGVTFRRAPREAVLPLKPRSLRDSVYEITWRTKESDYADQQEEPGRWLIFADRQGVAAALAALLEEREQVCRLVFPEDELDPASPEDFESALTSPRDGPPLRGVVYLWALEPAAAEPTAASLESEHERVCRGALHLVQAMARQSFPAPPRLCLVTRAAQAADPEDALDPRHEPLWGLAKVIPIEHPGLSCVMIDLDPAGEPGEQVRLLFEEAWATDREDQVAFRRGLRRVPRLVRSLPQPSRAGVEIRTDASYLVTGGFGALGIKVARALVDKGARYLALVGRNPPAGPAREVLRELELEGAHILELEADVARKEDVQRMLARIEASHPPLRGVIHAAGTLDDGVLLEQNWQRFAAVLRPKIRGAWNLHALCQGTELDFFVLFSSAASLLGSPGQANYAAANAFLDGLAHHRRSLGLPALSIHWGPWAGTGMTAGLGERDQRRWSARGVATIHPDEGVELLFELVETDAARLAVLPIDWARFVRQYPAGAEPPLLAELLHDARSRWNDEQLVERRRGLLDRLQAAPSEERAGILTEFVCGQVAEILGFESASALDPTQGFFDIGMDSLMATELHYRLQAGLGVSLPATIGFDQPNVDALARYLAGALARDLPEAPRPAARRAEARDDMPAALGSLDEEEIVRLFAEEIGKLDPQRGDAPEERTS